MLEHDNQTFQRISPEERDEILHYLSDHYTGVAIQECGVFLVVECGNVPDLDCRPLLVAAWIPVSGAPPADLSIGDLGQGEIIAIDEVTSDGLRKNSFPCPQTFFRLFDIFPDCEATSWLDQSLLVELIERNDHEYWDTLQQLPYMFSNVALIIRYTNGSVILSSHRWHIGPNSRPIDGKFDDTNYLSENCALYLGTMMSTSSGAFTCGIAVCKSG